MSAQSDREAARARLKESVDALTEQANLQLKMQQEPLKMLGGATGVGLALGMLVGRSFRRTRRVYVDAASTPKEQKALAKAQSKGGSSISGAVLATVATLGFRVLQERVIAPRLGDFADKLLEKSGGSAAAPRDAAPQETAGQQTGSQKPVDLSKH